ncbi:MAG: hypothetical protein IPH82_04330 [Chloroflexi bacterium]|nr:hypothetical protein [Chloroflexota bacterium]
MKIARLFGPFYPDSRRAKARRHRIGLTISHQFVELMGGTLQGSEIGQGSTFFLPWRYRLLPNG